MTDPFSVGAGAAGVISLGITVCQGLVAYYGPFTQYDPETKSFVKRTEALNDTLYQLESLLKTVQGPLHSHIKTEIDIVTQRVEDCKDELQCLSERLTKCRGYNATSTIQKDVWYYAKKASYPFKRGTIVALLDTVSGLQSNLGTALQILDIALSRRVDNQTTLTLSLTQSMSAVANDNSTILRNVEQIVQQMQQEQQRIQQDQQQMYQGQQQLCQAIMNSYQSSSTFTGATTRTQRLLPPATLQIFCDQQQAINSHVQQKQKVPRVKSAYKASSCTCPQNKNRSWSLFSLLPSHQYDCPLYLQGEDLILFQKQFTFCNWFLHRSIHITFGFSTAEGAFTMKPPFGARRVVPNNAPAFKLIEHFLLNFAGHTLDSLLNHLRSLFNEGKAFPRDTLSSGQTLLHYTSRYIFFLKPENFQDGLRILHELVDVYHVPVNEECQSMGLNLTFLDILTSRQTTLPSRYTLPSSRAATNLIGQVVPFILKTLAVGGEVTNATFIDTEGGRGFGSRLSHSLASRILPLIYDHLNHEDLNLSDFDIAILQRSEQELKRLVRSYTGKAVELRWEVLSSAIPWPSGLEIILNSSAFVCPENDCMLRQAIIDRQQESVQLLLTHGWPIGTQAFHDATGEAYQPQLFQTIVSELYQRRQHILHVVKADLPLELLGELGINDDTEVLDCDYHILREHLPGHPKVVHQEIFPVYQHCGFNIQAADTLYEAGFTNVEVGDKSPFLVSFPVPYPCSGYLEFCCWLQDKGASIHRNSRGTDLLPVHYIANALSVCLDDSWQSKDWMPLIARYAKFLGAVLTDTAHHDSCSCVCSDNGCLPSDVLMRHLLQRRRVRPQAHHMAAELISFLCSQDLKSAMSVCESMAPAVFRSCLLSELGITHTCMFHNFWCRMDLGAKLHDISGIHSEESHLIDRLEELVLEVDAKYKELSAPLPEFLTGWFDTKLQELRAEEKVYDEEEAQRMRSVGVIPKKPVQ